MAFQVSPGVSIKEIDATNVVPVTSSSVGGFAGAFNWGPIGEACLVSSENELAEKFATPDESNYHHFLVAASFLKYGNALQVVRASGGDLKNARVGSGTALLIKNESDYLTKSASALSTAGIFSAKYAGDLGNSLKVHVVTNATSFAALSAKLQAELDGAPSTSPHAAKYGITGDELHIIVEDEDGLISGTKGQVLEVFPFLSQASDAKKADGESIFYKDVINARSNYLWWGGHSSDLSDAGKKADGTASLAGGGSAFDTHDTVIGGSLTGGVNETAYSEGELQAGFDVLKDKATIDISLLFGAPDADGSKAMAEYLIDIAADRKDCVAFVSPPVADSVNGGASTVVTYAGGVKSSSYGVMDSSAVYVYDKYHDVYRYIGAAGHIAGLCAQTDNTADAWFSPAGQNRGVLRGVVKLAYNPQQAERDLLYKARVNPLVAFPGQGTILFGDKTLLNRPSAFDRINVRRLFVALEKSISAAAEAQLFEFNDEFTRAQFLNLVEPFLRDVKGRRGLTDFRVVCDETNNTSQVIDSNKFVADIYVKPARSINFIQLNFVATRSGAEFTEIAG